MSDHPKAERIAGQEWRDDCIRWRGVVLIGLHAHWCPDWDFLPIDETCPEWPCPCSESDGASS